MDGRTAFGPRSARYKGAPGLEHHDHAVPGPGRHYQRRDLCAARPCAGSGVRRYPRHPDSARRIRHLRRADLCFAVGGPCAGHRPAGAGDGGRGVRPRPVRRPQIAASKACRTGVRGQCLPARGHFRADLLARRPPSADRRQYRAVASDRRGDRAVSLSHRVSTACAYLGAGAVDRVRRLPSGAARFWPAVFRRGGPARSDACGYRLQRRPAALHRPEHRRLCHHHRLHCRAVAVFRLHALRQGAARHRRQPPRRAPGRHQDDAVGTDRFPAGLGDRGDFGNPDRADHDAVLRHRIPDRPERFHCRDHRRARQLSLDGGRGAAGRIRRSLFLVLCQQFQGSHRLHADHSGSAAALAGGAGGGRREGLTTMPQRLPIIIFAFVMAAIPFIPGMPPFWIVLLDNIGLAALVVMGLVLLTGVGGLTSFGQAAFCGFGAYTTAVLTTAYGVSPWLTLPLSLLVSGIAAVALGLVTVRLSGHYLPLGTLAWGLGLFYLFSKLEFLGRNDGISGIPPLAIGSFRMIDPGAIYYAIWIAVLIAALLTMNLLDSRTGRAIRALRRGHIAAEAFGVQAPRAKLLVFIYAAVLAGLSGWLYAHFQRAANPTPFGAQAGIEYLFIAVVGGAGYVWGGVLGAAIVVILKEILQSYLPYLFRGEGQLETIVFGILPAVLLRIDHARKQFGGVIAVNDVSFDVQAREIVALIGPNGAGKSTTFNLITGVLTSSGGTISVLGKNIDNAPPQQVAKLGIARTFQHVKLVPEMSVLENVAIGAHLRGHAGALSSMFRLDRSDEARLLAEAARQIERVGLGKEIDQFAGSLSLGQQRIVEIARALCVDPMLLLLDEPAAGLRHMEKQQLARLLRQLRDGGMSVLLVEHDMGFVMNLADRVVVLDFGTKIAEGTPDAIKTNPEVIEAYLGAIA